MNKQIIYLKETSSYDDILKNKYENLPLFIKKIIFIYKNIFNIITKKNMNGNEIWVLPIKEKYLISKLEKLFKKYLKNSNNICVLSKELVNNRIDKILKENNIQYISESKIKKFFVHRLLQYITSIQNKNISELDITILVNNSNQLNIDIIKDLAKSVKSIKIVSLKIYKFKKLEEELYNEYGIAIQFSNSYKKSLEKSKIIINFDFNEIEINEYEIYKSAIIINCSEDNIKVKSKLFNGIVINSFDIELKDEYIENLKQGNLQNDFKRVLLYAVILEKDREYLKVKERVERDNPAIISLVGNNGKINKKEFKIINKKLDKNVKKE